MRISEKLSLNGGLVMGRAYGHQTPVFAANIKSVIFRPYWNVPYRGAEPHHVIRFTLACDFRHRVIPSGM